MRNWICKLAITAMAAWVPTHALEYADIDLVNKQVSANNYVYGTFDLVNLEGDSHTFSGYSGDNNGNGTFSDIDGFELGDIVTEASVSFWFSDPNGGDDDGYEIRLKVSTWYSTIEEDIDFNTDHEFQTVLVDTWWHGSEILVGISQTGQLLWKIQPGGEGSFNVDAAMLTVQVPDGGSTAILLGVGMIGMAGLHRRLRK